MRITICAFVDSKDNSIGYRKFDDIEKAILFYRSMLTREDVNTISTRKIQGDL